MNPCRQRIAEESSPAGRHAHFTLQAFKDGAVAEPRKRLSKAMACASLWRWKARFAFRQAEVEGGPQV